VLLAGEIRVDKEALGVLAIHAQAMKEQAQKESLTMRTQKARVPWQREKMRDQPSDTSQTYL
jgi:hypothetical protein